MLGAPRTFSGGAPERYPVWTPTRTRVPSSRTDANQLVKPRGPIHGRCPNEATDTPLSSPVSADACRRFPAGASAAYKLYGNDAAGKAEFTSSAVVVIASPSKWGDLKFGRRTPQK